MHAGGTEGLTAPETVVQSLEFYLSGRFDPAQRAGFDGEVYRDALSLSILHHDCSKEYSRSACRPTIPAFLDCTTCSCANDCSHSSAPRPDLCDIKTGSADSPAASSVDILAPDVARGQPPSAHKYSQGEKPKEKALAKCGAGALLRQEALLDELRLEGHVRDRGGGVWEISFLATVATTYTPTLLVNGCKINLGAVTTRVRP